MTIRQRSILGWLIGAGLGAIAGAIFVPNRNSKIKSKLFGSVLGAVGGSALVGSVNDKRLENKYPSYN